MKAEIPIQHFYQSLIRKSRIHTIDEFDLDSTAHDLRFELGNTFESLKKSIH